MPNGVPSSFSMRQRSLVRSSAYFGSKTALAGITQRRPRAQLSLKLALVLTVSLRAL